MITIMGYERKCGEFQPSGSASSLKYDNVIFHVLNDNCGIVGFVGSSCEQLKVKVTDLPKLFNVNFEELKKFVGVPVQFDYSLISGKPVLTKVVILDSNEDFQFKS